MNKKEYIQPMMRCSMILDCSIAAGSITMKDDDADPNSPMMSKEVINFVGEDVEE